MEEVEITFPQKASEAFPKEALDRIAETIKEVEQETSAEIRISIRESRDSNEADLSLDQIALREFALLKMDQTADRTGILLLVLYNERKFYIYGDVGINARSDTNTWTNVADVLKQHFKQGKFEEGVHASLRAIIPHVKEVLPRKADDIDELSNEVSIR